MTLADVLDQIAEHVSRGSCTCAPARDGDGHPVAVMSDRAAVFCSVGAAMRVTRRMPDGNFWYMLAFERLDRYARSQRATCLATWHDAMPHESVVAAIKQLAEDARAEEIERAERMAP